MRIINKLYTLTLLKHSINAKLKKRDLMFVKKTLFENNYFDEIMSFGHKAASLKLNVLSTRLSFGLGVLFNLFKAINKNKRDSPSKLCRDYPKP